MPKTLKKKNRQTHRQPRRTRQRTNKKTRGRRLRKSRTSRNRRTSRKMKGGVASDLGVGLLSGEEKSPLLGEKIADLTSSFSSSFSSGQQPVAESGGGYQQIPDSPEPVNTPQDLDPERRIDIAYGEEYTLKEFQEQYPEDWKVRWDAAVTLPPPPPVQQPAVQQPLLPGQPAVQQPGPLTREQVDKRKKKAADLMALAQAAVIDAGAGEAALARSRAAAAAASVASAAAAAAEKAKPVAEGAAKVAAAGVGATGLAAGGVAAAPYIAAGAAAAAPVLLPTLALGAGVGAGAMAGKFAVNKTMQLGKLAKKATDIKTLIWAIKVLTKEGWQFILPGQTVATTLELAIAWIKANYKSVNPLPAKPDHPQLDGTPTPVSP